MVIEMNDEQLRTVADLQGFLDGTVAMDFTVGEDERYAFIARTVKRFGYLTHRIDLSFWERRGIQAAQVREWIDRIDRLAGLSLIRSDRKRRDRMPDSLIECGQRALDALDEHPIADPEATLARCLVGFGNAVTGNRVDPMTGAELKAWLEFRNPSMRVEIARPSRGECRYTLIIGSAISHVMTQLFLVVLAVRLLSKESIDSKVTRYRRVSHASMEGPDSD
jgi:hypothetical protein